MEGLPVWVAPLLYVLATRPFTSMSDASLGGSLLARSSATAHEVAALFACANEDEFARLEKRYADDPRKQVQHAREVAKRRLARERGERERVLGM